MSIAKSVAGLPSRDGSASAGRYDHHWWSVILIFWALLAFVYVYVGFEKVSQGFADTDIATRLVQLREFWEGQDWYDMTISRLAPDVGYVSHWSRILDAALTGLYRVFLLFLDPQQAELAMRTAWPLLMLLVAMLSAVLIARRLAGSDQVVILVALMAAFALPFRFFVGDIDHHGAQVALLLATWAALAHADRSKTAAFASGVFLTLSMAISLESLPLLLPVSILVLVLYVKRGRRAHAIVRPHLAGLLFGSLVFLSLTVPPVHWLDRIACDAYGANWALPVALMAGMGLLMLHLPLQDRGARSRAISVGVVAALGALVFVGFDPACLKGPFAHMDPGLRPVWLDHVKEVQPIWKRGLSAAFRAIWVWSALALMLAVWAFGKKGVRTDAHQELAAAERASERLLPAQTWFVFGYILGVALAVFLSARMIRYLTFAEWLALPAMAASLHLLMDRQKRMASLARTIAVVLMSPLLWAIMMIQFWPEGTAAASERQRERCLKNAVIDRLNQVPEGIIASSIDMGPFILARTRHSVLFAPYHRLNSSLLDVSRIFAAPLSKSRAVLHRRGATYVLFCEGNKPPRTLEGNSPPEGSLWRRLEKGDLPPWLEPVDLGGDSPLRLYRVRLDRAASASAKNDRKRAEAKPILRKSIQ